MAFFSKVGSLLRQTASKQISSELSASRPSIYQAIRCMSSSKLFVGGLSYNTDDQSLREAFGKYGYVAEARVILDRETGRSRGFGFITYSSAEEASSAIQALDGQDLHGRRVRVNYATDRARGSGGYGSPGGYGGGGDGGYGGGYGGNAYGAPSGNYGGNSGGGGGNYGSSYGGGNASYGGAGNYSSGNTFDSGNTGGFSSGVAGGDSGIDGGVDGNVGAGYGSGNQFGSFDSNQSGSFPDSSQGYSPDGPVEGNTRDDLDDAGDFAKRA
ncbi:hypothetical protein ACOSP7_023691 [Xanthoceras sorbifolium]|uniref:RRM domain-containing protein n=1 Tax=Xanthoceras sorbifolium TaxID=99658 RepID=A0ABQ8HA43_9ROSI|nr:hypothetical protein JRO89_XS13G0263300 [Xanthoceras sorbifolium]